MSPNQAKRPAVCVFCGSSPGDSPAFTDAAKRLGDLIATENYQLVFGGGGVGLMGVLAAAVARNRGKILGIIPDFLRHVEAPLNVESEIVITTSMNDRKAQMFAASDGFVVLAGGLGTLDEFAEAFTGAQLALHDKPIFLVNTENYWDPLLSLIDHFIQHGFAKPPVKSLFTVVATPEEAIKAFTAHVRTKQKF